MYKFETIHFRRVTHFSCKAVIRIYLLMGLHIPALLCAAERPHMTWTVQDIPPGFILVEGKPTDGIFDKVINMLIEEWPGVDHEFMDVSIPRGLANLSNGIEACFGGVLMTPEREKFAYYSLMFQLMRLVETAWS